MTSSVIKIPSPSVHDDPMVKVVVAKTISEDEEEQSLDEHATPVTPNTTPSEMGGHPRGAYQEKYPRSVLFIIGNEFCERFSYYGMKAVLPVFLTAKLGFSENKATTVIHSFNFMCYFFTLFGGILSDTWTGKFKTILCLSLVYCLGSAAMAASAFPSTILGAGVKVFGVALGLSLIGVGTGGIKPCVSTFGGDQFDAKRQARWLASYFSYFYLAVNLGSLLSMFLTPILRSDVHCLGEESCYPLAFGLPALLMMLATGIFVAGSFFYKRKGTNGNEVLGVAKAVRASIRYKARAVRERWAGRPVPKASTWYAYALLDGYTPEFMDGVRRVVQIIKVFTLVLFWALYDQQGSRWTFQAMTMNGLVKIGSWRATIKPEQIQIVNAILVILMIPCFNSWIYPILTRCGLPLSSVVRMGIGMGILIVSFVCAGLLQLIINQRSTLVPNPADPTTLMCTDGCLHVLWQLPQYVLISVAEVLTSISGMEFAYNEAPDTLKGVCQAIGLLCTAFGNLLVMLVSLIDPVGRVGKGRWSEGSINVGNFFMWSCFATIALCFYIGIVRRYYDTKRSPESVG